MLAAHFHCPYKQHSPSGVYLNQYPEEQQEAGGGNREVVENKRMVFEAGWGGKEVRRRSKIIKQNYQLVA